MSVHDLCEGLGLSETFVTEHAASLMLLGHLFVSEQAAPPELLNLDSEDAGDMRIAEVLDAAVALAKAGEPTDELAVLRKLREWGAMPGEGHALIIAAALHLIGYIPDSAPGRIVRDVCAEFRTRRQARLLRSGAERARDGEPPEQILRDLEEQARGVEARGATDTGDIREAVFELVRKGKGAKGSPTCFAAIDRYTGGRRRAELTFIAARPGIGKSAMALQEAIAEARRGRNVAMWTLENSKHQTVRRALAHMSNVEHARVRDGTLVGHEESRVAEAMAELADMRRQFRLFGGGAEWSVGRVCAAARAAHAEVKIDLLVVDPLSGLHLEGGKDERLDVRIGHQLWALKRLAVDLDTHVLVVHHLNREADKGRPTKSALKNSGVSEEIADVLIFLWPEDARRQDEVTAIVDKARDGETGEVKLRFHGSRMRFEEM